MGQFNELNPTSENLESENATTNNGDEANVHPDEPTLIGSDKKLISLSSGSSSTSSDLSLLQDLQILDSEHDETHNENMSDSGCPTIQEMEHPETIPSHVFSKKMFTGPGNWSMASNESLFSIRMDSTSFYHLDSFSPLFDLPNNSQCVDGMILETDQENNRGSSVIDEPAYEEDKESHFSATSSSRSSSNSLVFPILSGETENGGSPYPRDSLIGPVSQSPPKPEPTPDPQSEPKASGVEAEAKETTAYIAWTAWFPCFRYCACCS